MKYNQENAVFRFFGSQQEQQQRTQNEPHNAHLCLALLFSLSSPRASQRITHRVRPGLKVDQLVAFCFSKSLTVLTTAI